MQQPTQTVRDGYGHSRLWSRSCSGLAWQAGAEGVSTDRAARRGPQASCITNDGMSSVAALAALHETPHFS